MSVEFRIPIAPTQSFFDQVEFFNFGLRRLGGCYESAPLRVFVGDKCDLDAVLAHNRWSERWPVNWHRVSDEISDRHGMYGTANSRFGRPDPVERIVVMADADTLLLRDIDDIIARLTHQEAMIAGHVAHFPPEENGTILPDPRSPQYWPTLFGLFGLELPENTFRYTMDASGELPRTPAYFNLGFVALNRHAFDMIGREIHDTHRRLAKLTSSFMRCQIALAVIVQAMGIKAVNLGAIYNAANDPSHLEINDVSHDEIRVLHYLRQTHVDRSRIGDLAYIREISEKPQFPVNRTLLDALLAWHGTR